MTPPSRTGRLALLCAILLLLLGGRELGAAGATQSADVKQPVAGYAPTAEDAARAASEQIKTLPAGAVQVECAPGVPTLPIYTTMSGLGGPQQFYILADGRCFQDKLNNTAVPVERIDEAASD